MLHLHLAQAGHHLTPTKSFLKHLDTLTHKCHTIAPKSFHIVISNDTDICSFHLFSLIYIFSVPPGTRHLMRFDFLSWFSTDSGMFWECAQRSCYFFSFPATPRFVQQAARLLPFHKEADAQHRMTQRVGNRMRTKMCYPPSDLYLYLYLVLPTLVFAACMFSW